MLYFIRHGSTDWNEHKVNGVKTPKCQGRADIPLNQKGIDEAIDASSILKNINFDKIICSPLKRTLQTCQIIAHKMGWEQQILIDERIIERDFGEFEGLTRTDFDFKSFWNIKSKQKYKKAETIDDVKKRVISLLDELKQTPNQNILIVSHGGVGCVLTSYFKGVPQDGNLLSFEIPHGKPLIFDFNQK